MKWASVSACCVLCLAPAICGAQGAPTVAPTQLLTKVSVDDFISILKEDGFPAEKVPGKNGIPFAQFHAEGYVADAFFEDSDTTIMLWLSFSDMKMSPEQANEWNMNNRFSRTYIQERPNLEFDIDIGTGITRAYLASKVKTFRDIVGKWAQFCINATAEYNKLHPAPK